MSDVTVVGPSVHGSVELPEDATFSDFVNFVDNNTTTEIPLDDLRDSFGNLDVSEDGVLQEDEQDAGSDEITALIQGNSPNFEAMSNHSDSRDGIQKTEFIQYATENTDVERSEARELFNSIDADGDGTVSASEFADNESSIDNFFGNNQYDENNSFVMGHDTSNGGNNDGFLNKTEAIKLAQAEFGDHFSEADLTQMFNEEVGADGQMTSKEGDRFIDRLTDRFNR